MPQISHFLLVSESYDDDLLAAFETLDDVLAKVSEYLKDHTMHCYFPVRVVVVDTDDREMKVATVSL